MFYVLLFNIDIIPKGYSGVKNLSAAYTISDANAWQRISRSSRKGICLGDFDSLL